MSQQIKIPFVDLHAQYKSIASEVTAAMMRVLVMMFACLKRNSQNTSERARRSLSEADSMRSSLR
jgi:hypothetical protein